MSSRNVLNYTFVNKNGYWLPTKFHINLDNPRYPQKKTNMVTFTPATPTNIPQRNNVAIVLDRSSSMAPLRQAAIDSLNAQIQSLRNESQRNGIETTVTLVTFSDDVTIDINAVNINTIGSIDSGSYQPHGNTALWDAIGHAIETLRYRGGLKQVIVVTDGEENQSRTFRQTSLTDLIRSLDKNWTMAGCVPPNRAHYLTSLGFAPGNVVQWENTVRGMEVVTQRIATANTTRYGEITRGLTSTNMYFAPDVNVSPTIVQTNLNDLTNNFTVHNVSQKSVIADFVATVTNKPYRIGGTFYQLTKPEKVQAHKEIVIRDKMGRIFGGDNARSLLRIPAGGEIKLNPASSPDYEVFVQSKAPNRHLMPNTNILVAK
jgi:hypothetical protein